MELEYFNEFAEYKHYKMEFFEDVFKIIKEDGWRASVDLKDVFFTIPVHILHQKNFKSKSFIKF